jgi:hypothetical protein
MRSLTKNLKAKRWTMTRWLADELVDTGRTLREVFATTPCY